MSVIRVEKNQNYTCMSNYHLKEKDMSLKAKGLLSLMLSLPNNWDYSINGLVSICKENETSIKSTLSELKEFGYLEVIKNTPNATNGGRISYDYIVHEKPTQDIEKQGVENLGVEFLGVDNQVQLNTNELNTKYLLKKERPTFDDLIENYTHNEQLRYELKEHLKTRKLKKVPLTNRAIELELNNLDKLTTSDEQKIAIVQKSIVNGWTEFFPPKQQMRTKSQLQYNNPNQKEFEDLDRFYAT